MADIFNLTDTWNNAGTTFSAIKMNVTNTASAAASKMLDLQVDATSRFNVGKDGYVYLPGDSGGRLQIHMVDRGAVLDIYGTGFGDQPLNCTAPGGLTCNTNTGAFSLGAAVDVRLFRDAAGSLAQRNGTNAQTFNIYNTFTDAANYERLALTWSSNVCYARPQNAGTGAARLFVPVTGATTVAGLPAAATAGAGARAMVTDATVTTFASAVVGGGANTVPVYSTGAAWNIG